MSIETCYEAGYLAKVPWRGGDLTPLTPVCGEGTFAEESAPGYSRPDAAPDGRSLLTIRRVEHCCPEFVWLAADGSAEAVVPIPKEEVTFDPSGPSFAPSGASFAFEGDDWSGGVERGSLWEVSLDGASRRRIDEQWPCEGGLGSCPVYENPSWSPDGRLIAVNVVQSPRSGLWLIRARDGKPVRRIAGSRAFEPDWSPDGRKLVFRTHYEQREVEGGAAGGNLYVVSRDGKRRRRLVHRENIAETQPTWSPDGRWIAWVSLKFGAGDVGFDVRPSLWRVRAGGGPLRKIRGLPDPYVEEGFYVPPHLTWLPRR